MLLLQSNLESMLWDNHLDKPTSNIYKTLLPSVPFGLEALFSKWQSEIPDLDSDYWEDTWEYLFLQLISLRDWLIKLKLIHQVYMSPPKNSRIYPNSSSSCWKSGNGNADFNYMLWSCPRVQDFWERVMGFITTLTMIQIPLNMSVCLLGLVDSLAHCRVTRTQPYLNIWKSLINSAVPLYKAVYLARCCPAKFNKIWHIWLDSDTTNATQ